MDITIPVKNDLGQSNLLPPEPVESKKSTFTIPTKQPTLDAVDGIKFDFNYGIRVFIPEYATHSYHITFTDADAGVVLYANDVAPGATVTSVKKFFVAFHLEIRNKAEEAPIFTHDFDAHEKDVLLDTPPGAIGDTIGWFSYMERFQQKHNCRLTIRMDKRISCLFEKCYPNIKFTEEVDTESLQPYATYYLGLFFKGDVDNQPVDFRYIGLHRTAGYILGVDPADIPPRVDLTAKRAIKGRYVCIAAQGSSMAKNWNNPVGWMEVISFLKKAGYRVLCLDRDRVVGEMITYNKIPFGCEDFTGDLPLRERINLIKDADFFIGLSSGLSWVAWCCKVPVVLISGFTHPTNEFNTPYRVINYHACNSCWNDMRCEFNHSDFLWCPRHKGDPRQFECSRLISAEQVIKVIKNIPEFQRQATRNAKKINAAPSSKENKEHERRE